MKFYIFFRLYYVSQEKRQRSDNCCQCLIQPSERQFAITFSFFGILAVLIFFILTWIYGFDFGGAFGKACLKPDDTFQMKTFGTFGKIWAFAGFVIFVNILGILVSSSLYFWLRIQDNSMLRNAKVGIIAIFINLNSESRLNNYKYKRN